MYRFRPLVDNIFLLEFDDKYDLAMHFVRMQEFYECPNDKFRGRIFDIWDYIEWYSKENDNMFTYPHDWCGFNIPGSVMKALYLYGPNPLPGHNKYDEFMRGLLSLIHSQTGDEDFYLIGSKTGDSDTINHEMAHGLWNLDEEYRKAQISSVDNLPEELYEKLESNLRSMGYTKAVVDDEIQAYMSSGFTDSFIKGCGGKAKMLKRALPFINLYHKFTSEVCLSG